METSQANAELVPTTAPVTAPVVAPAGDNLIKQNGTLPGSEAVDIDALPSNVLDQVSDDLRNHIPADAKGKALDKARGVVAKGSPAELEKKEVVPPAEVPAPEPAPGVVIDPNAEVVPPAPAAPALETEPEKNPQRRVRGEKPEDDMALDIFQTRQRIGKPISMLEASLEANRILGIGEAEPEPAPAPKSVASAEAELASLREQRRAANIAFDGDAVDAAQIAIEAKIEEIRDIKQDSVARQQLQQHQVNSDRQKSANKAWELYPDLEVKPGVALSPIAVAKDEIHAALVASNDPVINTPDYPLHLAQLAAKQTQTPPWIPGKAPVVSQPVQPRSVQPTKPVAPLASATARTTPPTKGQGVEAALDGMSDRQFNEVVSALPQFLKR